MWMFIFSFGLITPDLGYSDAHLNQVSYKRDHARTFFFFLKSEVLVSQNTVHQLDQLEGVGSFVSKFILSLIKSTI